MSHDWIPPDDYDDGPRYDVDEPPDLDWEAVAELRAGRIAPEGAKKVDGVWRRIETVHLDDTAGL